jgi:hypothetical protein
MNVCSQGTDRHQETVPKSVPERSPTTIIRQPTPTKVPINNGPEVFNFRPVLGFPTALANRPLQPLGHLTAARNLSMFSITLL